MKKTYAIAAIFSAFILGSARAENITVYYSPSCPHCHHALDFLGNELVYEYLTIDIKAINVMEDGNGTLFQDVLKKCKFDVGGIPVIVIGDECIQGYGEKTNQKIRDAVSVNMSESEKEQSDLNRKALERYPEKFKLKHADRAKIIQGYEKSEQKKTENKFNIIPYVILVLVSVVAVLIIKKKRKK